MRKWITFLMTLLVASSASYVSAFNDSQINFEAGYRHDDISWKAKLPADDPIFGAETRFKDLDIFQIGVNARTGLGCNFYIRGDAYWGWILDGKVEQETKFFASGSPFFSDDITFAVRDENIADKGWVFGFDVAIGYPFYFCNCTTSLSPVVGYAFDEQNIHFDENDRLAFESFSSGSFESIFEPVFHSGCCTNKFIARWYGPFVGLDFNYDSCSCWNVYASLEYHWAQFKPRRHVESGFGTFNHFHKESNAHGWLFNIGANYEFCQCWTLGAEFTYRDFGASRRHHFEDDSFSSSFFSDDRFKTSADWRSYFVGITAGYRF